MQLCEAKGCWLVDLEDVPSQELPYWLAYYEEQEKARKRAEAKANAKRR